MPVPAWLSLLSPLPDEARPQRKPVASAEMIASGTAGPIAGWESISINLSEPAYGLRHVHVTLDETGRVIAGSDHVMFVREVTANDDATLTDHESIGGRFEVDGSFRGTYWKTRLQTAPGADEGETVSADRAVPTVEQVVRLREIVDVVLSRSD